MARTKGDTFRVERSTTIDAPAERIFEWLNDFRRWTEWSPWEDVDPDLRRSYDGPQTGVGSGYAWQGNRKAGSGRMEITGADHPRGIDLRIDFLKPFRSTNQVHFELAPTAAEGPTRVTWSMTGPKTLGTKLMGLFSSMDKMIGPDFEKGLGRLKAVAER